MSFSENAWQIFNQSIIDYHINDNVDAEMPIPFEKHTLEHILYSKNWIDTVQWHLEDIIRDENIHPEEALKLKRRIDASNQKRTDLVEYVDHWFYQKYLSTVPKPDAKINTETPAWAVDRLSILALKIYHMNEEATRAEATAEHRAKCQEKLNVLLDQKNDMFT